jgi:hypothetical protein
MAFFHLGRLRCCAIPAAQAARNAGVVMLPMAKLGDLRHAQSFPQPRSGEIRQGFPGKVEAEQDHFWFTH